MSVHVDNPELKLVAVELAKTLGFCHGILDFEKKEYNCVENFKELIKDFPAEFLLENGDEMSEAYLNEYMAGKEFADELR